MCNEPPASLVRSRVSRIPRRAKKHRNLVVANKVVRQRRNRRPPGGGCARPFDRWANMRAAEPGQIYERVDTEMTPSGNWRLEQTWRSRPSTVQHLMEFLECGRI